MKADDRAVLIGMALGDGYINTTGRKSELSVAHSVAQRDYCEHKAARVRQILGGAFNVREYANGPAGAYRAVKFVSSNKYWTQIRGWLYPNGVKQYTDRVLNMLNDEAIAIWYMDDGNARRNVSSTGWITSVSTNIATMCSESEALTVVAYFAEVHDIHFKIRCRKSAPPNRAFFIECNTAESRKFAALVRPYVIDSMMYKLSHVADLSSHECRTPTGTCVQCSGAIYAFRRGGLCDTCYSRRYYRQVRKFRENRADSKRGFYKGDDIVRPNGNTEPLEVVDKEPPR